MSLACLTALSTIGVLRAFAHSPYLCLCLRPTLVPLEPAAHRVDAVSYTHLVPLIIKRPIAYLIYGTLSDTVFTTTDVYKRQGL